MTVREVAVGAAAILQADDIMSALESNDEDALSDQDVKTLVKCVNLAAAEMFSDAPIYTTVTLEATNGEIPYSSFPAPPSIVRAVMRCGAVRRFGTSGAGLRVDGDGAYEVEYATRAADKTIDQELELSEVVDPNVVAYLAARNYCLVTGRTDEAAIWDQRFNAEWERPRLARRAVLPRRRWA